MFLLLVFLLFCVSVALRFCCSVSVALFLLLKPPHLNYQRHTTILELRFAVARLGSEETVGVYNIKEYIER